MTVLSIHTHNHGYVNLYISPLSIACIVIVVLIIAAVMWESRKGN
jgi:hypothetical protein